MRHHRKFGFPSLYCKNMCCESGGGTFLGVTTDNHHFNLNHNRMCSVWEHGSWHVFRCTVLPSNITDGEHSYWLKTVCQSWNTRVCGGGWGGHRSTWGCEVVKELSRQPIKRLHWLNTLLPSKSGSSPLRTFTTLQNLQQELYLINPLSFKLLFKVVFPISTFCSCADILTL